MGSKNAIDDICKAEIEKQIQRTNTWMPRGKEGERNWEIGTDIYTLLTMYKRDN